MLSLSLSLSFSHTPLSLWFLTPLNQLVEARVQTYHKLLKLEGRLDLALSQVCLSVCLSLSLSARRIHTQTHAHTHTDNGVPLSLSPTFSLPHADI